MELHQVLIKNFQDYLNGREVEAIAEIKDNKVIRPGEKILAFNDSIAATSTIAVPKSKQDQAIGIEGKVIETEIRQPVKSGKHVQVLKVVKI